MSNLKRREREPVVLRQQASSVTYTSGPIPSASELARYETTHPGLADRIMRMAEDQAQHRQGLEKAVVVGNLKAQTLGQWFAFILSLVVIVAGVWLVLLGKTSLGVWFILGDVLVIAGVFIGAKLIQRGERKQRRQELEPQPERRGR